MEKEKNYLTKGGKRFVVGEFPQYDKEYNKLKLESPITNPGAGIPNIYSKNLNDPTQINHAIRELVGNKEGKFFYPEMNQYFDAQIPSLKARVQEQEKTFANYQQQRVNAGYARPKVRPTEMQEEYLKALARLDFAEFELYKLQDMLSKFTKADDTIRESKILQRGLQQSGRMGEGNILCEIDGQHVGQINGVLCIDDDASPYDGLTVAAYRALADEWMAARFIAINEATIKYHAEMRQFGKSDIVIPSRNNTVPKASLPKYPEGAHNMKNIKQDSVSSM